MSFPVFYIVGSAAADVVAALVSLAFLYESYRTGNWAWIRRPWVLATWALWGYFTLRGAFAEDAGAAVGRAVAWIRYPLFAMALAFYALRSPQAQRGLSLALTAVLAVLMVDSVLQYLIGSDVLGRLPQASLEGSLRLTGPFKDPKVGIVLAWLAFPVLTDLIRVHFALAGAFALALLLTVFLSGERMALLLVLLGFALLTFGVRALRLPALAAMATGAAVAFVVAQANPALMTRQYDSTLRTIAHYEESPYGQIWRSAVAMIEAHPVFGVGGKHFRSECPKPEYGTPEKVETRCNLHPHQLYLEWWTEGGAVALLLFATVLFLLFKDAVTPWRRLRENALYLGLLAALCLRVWPLTTSTSFFVAWSALPFWLVAGWLLALAYEEKILEIRD